MNSELFGWALHQSCTHDQRINGSPVSPLRALRGQCPCLSLSECEASDTQTVIVVFKDLVVLRQ